MEAEISCPYCGEQIAVWVDGAGSFIEDCSVCCRPIELSASLSEDGEPVVDAHRGDD